MRLTHKQARELGGVLAEVVDRIEAEGQSARPDPPVAEKGRYTITIRKWHPLKLNAIIGRHPMKIHKLKQADYDFLAHVFRFQIPIPKAVCKRRVSLTIILGPRQRGGDPDSYLKVLGDGLVQCGQLVDDSQQWVEWASVQFRRGPEMGTEIVLEDT